jgi:hypothetical protein
MKPQFWIAHGTHAWDQSELVTEFMRNPRVHIVLSRDDGTSNVKHEKYYETVQLKTVADGLRCKNRAEGQCLYLHFFNHLDLYACMEKRWSRHGEFNNEWIVFIEWLEHKLRLTTSTSSAGGRP